MHHKQVMSYMGRNDERENIEMKIQKVRVLRDCGSVQKKTLIQNIKDQRSVILNNVIVSYFLFN